MKVYDSEHEFEYPWSEVSIANWRKYCPWNRESKHVIAVDTLSRRVDGETGILRTERLITCKQAAPKWIKPFLGGAEVSYVYELSYVTPPKQEYIASSLSSSSSSSSPVDSSASTSSSSPSSSSSSATSTTPTTSSVLTTSTPPTLSPPLAAAKSSYPSVTMISQNMTWSELLSVHETVSYTPSPDDPHSKTRFRQHANITALCGGWQKVRDKVESFTVERFGQNAERGRVGFEEVLETSRRVFGEERERERATNGR